MKRQIMKYAFIACVIALASSFTAHSASTWDAGGGSDASITLAGNWDDDMTPTLTGGTSVLTFGTGGSSANITTAVDIAGIVFNRSSGAFTLNNSGGSLSLGASGITATNTSGTQATYISNLGATLTANQTWSSTNTPGASVIRFQGGAITGDYSITKTGNGTVDFNNTVANTFTGNYSALGGQTNIASTATLGSSAGNLIISNDARVLHSNTGGAKSFDREVIINGGLISSEHFGFGGNATASSVSWDVNSNISLDFTGAAGLIIPVSNTDATFDGTITSAGTTARNVDFRLRNDGNFTRTVNVNGAIDLNNGALFVSGRSQTGETHGAIVSLNTTGNDVGEIRIGSDANRRMTLRFGANQFAGNNTTLTVNLGIVDLNGTNQTFGLVSGLAAIGTYGPDAVITNGNATASTLTVGSGVTSSFSETFMRGVIQDGAGSISLVKIGNGIQVLSANNSWSGTTTISSGTLRIGGNGTASTTTGTLGSGDVTNNGNLNISRSNDYNVTNLISGTGNVTQSGTGTTTLNGANSYSGQTTISAGVLEASVLANGGANSSIGSSSNANDRLIFASPTATLRYTGSGNVTTDRGFTLSSGGGGTIESSGAGTLSFDNTVGINYGIANTVRSFTLGGTNTGNNTFGKVLANNGSGATSLTKNGTGRWVLTQANTYNGTTTVNAGTLVVSAGNINNTSAISVSGSSSRLTYESATGLNRNVTVTSGAALRYNSSVSYSGALTFTNGTLEGTNWNGNLSGLTITTGRTISPGNSPGTATTGTQTWGESGSYVWEINNATGTAGFDPGWDLVDASGALTLSSTAVNPFAINIVSLTLGNVAGEAANFNDLTSYTWKIAEAGSSISGFSTDIFSLNTSGFENTFTGTFGIALGNSPGIGGTDAEIYLTYTAVPEPATWALLAVALTFVVVLRRRRMV